MKQQIINAGKAEYAAQFLTSIPYGYIDKTICGCGLTTVALENNENVVLAVPSVALISNKMEQYPNQRCKHILLGVYGDVTANEITAYAVANNVGKIMVTYDSLHKVAHLLDNGYRLIIDESDKLLALTNLKVVNRKEAGKIDVINQVLDIAKAYKETVSFISATPIPLDYMPEWVSTIPNVKIVWENTTKTLPYLMQRAHPYAALTKEVILPLRVTGSFTVGGVTATKAIIFLNSLQAITSAIKTNGLRKDEVAIICGDSVKNAVTIAGYNTLTDPANLPRYTFVTSTGFQGIDLYDKDAASVVVSCTARNFTMIDILTDLKQASSRNRDKSNANYGKYLYIYNQSLFETTEAEILKKCVSQRKWITNTLTQYDQMIKGNAEAEETFANVTATAPLFQRYTYEVVGGYELNDMLFKADQYMIVETRRAYVRGFDVVRIAEGSEVALEQTEVSKCIATTLSNSYKDLTAALKASDYSFLNEEPIALNEKQSTWGGCVILTEWVEVCRKSYEAFGNVVCNITEAIARLAKYKKVSYSADVRAKVLRKFVIGKRYSRTEVKEFLTTLYSSNDIDRVAKYTDLLDFFELEEGKVRGERCVTPTARKK